MRRLTDSWKSGWRKGLLALCAVGAVLAVLRAAAQSAADEASENPGGWLERYHAMPQGERLLLLGAIALALCLALTALVLRAWRDAAGGAASRGESLTETGDLDSALRARPANAARPAAAGPFEAIARLRARLEAERAAREMADAIGDGADQGAEDSTAADKETEPAGKESEGPLALEPPAQSEARSEALARAEEVAALIARVERDLDRDLWRSARPRDGGRPASRAASQDLGTSWTRRRRFAWRDRLASAWTPVKGKSGAGPKVIEPALAKRTPAEVTPAEAAPMKVAPPTVADATMGEILLHRIRTVGKNASERRRRLEDD